PRRPGAGPSLTSALFGRFLPLRVRYTISRARERGRSAGVALQDKDRSSGLDLLAGSRRSIQEALRACTEPRIFCYCVPGETPGTGFSARDRAFSKGIV